MNISDIINALSTLSWYSLNTGLVLAVDKEAKEAAEVLIDKVLNHGDTPGNIKQAIEDCLGKGYIEC